MQRAEPFLSEQRKERLRQVKSESDKINCCASFLLLRAALVREYGVLELPVFGFGEKDKPFLKNIPKVYFNFSHGKNGAACMVSDRNTAVDMMDIRKTHSAVYRRCCSEEECLALEQSADLARDFIRLWTRKECYAKLTGQGLSLDFRTITQSLPEMVHIHTLEQTDWILSYYSVIEQESVQFFDGESLLGFAEENGFL